MRFIQQFGYTVKVGQDEAQQKWLRERGGPPRGRSRRDEVPRYPRS